MRSISSSDVAVETSKVCCGRSLRFSSCFIADYFFFFFFQAEDGIRDGRVTGVQTCALPIFVKVVRGLPADLPAAVFVVLHIPAHSPSLLPVILSRAGPLPAVHPTDDTKIARGSIYIAPPDHHMLLEQDHICVVRGPKENRHRPAVDPTLRSAALTYGPRVIGVILTG